MNLKYGRVFSQKASIAELLNHVRTDNVLVEKTAVAATENNNDRMCKRGICQHATVTRQLQMITFADNEFQNMYRNVSFDIWTDIYTNFCNEKCARTYTLDAYFNE